MKHSAPKGRGAQSVAEMRLRELRDLDSRILSLLAERARILSRELAWRRSRKLPKVDAELEKQLRQAFEAEALELGLDAKLIRQVFGLLGQFALVDAAPPASGDAYNLAPRMEPAQAAIDGPRSFLAARCRLALAAFTGTALTLRPAPMNAPVKDFAKALKKAGTTLSWDTLGIDVEPGAVPALEGQMLFAGDDAFNFYLLLALGLTQAGRIKFNGKTTLQMLDLSPLTEALAQLGARIQGLNPSTPGLPARLECGGQMAKSVRLPDGVDPEFAPALACAAWAYPDGLTIENIPRSGMGMVEDVAQVLRDCGIDAQCAEASITVPAGTPAPPAQPELPLHAQFSAFLLALPAFTGGSITVRGLWPEGEANRALLDELRATGLNLEEAEGGIIATRAKAPASGLAIGLSRLPGCYPLALALGLLAGKATLPGPAPEEAIDLLGRLQASFDQTDEGIALLPGDLVWDEPWTSPDPRWTLALALMAYVKPHLSLNNHSELTAIWPQFWNFYNTLPTGEMKPRPERREETSDDSRRRYRVRS